MEMNMMKKLDKKAFTLVEMLILVMILSIIAVSALPMIGSASTMQIKAAANKIAADLEYAKSMAISRQKKYSIFFDIDNESYQILDSDGVIIKDPMQTSKDFVVEFKKDSRISQVNILSVSFDSAVVITFDYLGSPYSGMSSNSLIDGSSGITLKAGDTQMEILVEPITGYINIR
jgi:Tfp pilus assembly protein FimT